MPDFLFDQGKNKIEGSPKTVIDAMQAEIDGNTQAIQSTKIFPSDIYWPTNPLKNKLFRTFEGIRTDFDVSSLKPETGKTYYIAPNGNDSNTGLDSSHPLQKLSTALAKDDVNTIIVLDGIYNLGRVGGAFSKAVSIIAAENAHPVFIMSRDKTWTQTGGYSYVYQTTDSAQTYYGIVKATERDANGDLLHYSIVNSIEEVETNENTYFVDGQTIYVHSNGAPSRLYVLVSGINLHATYSNGETLYIEGCEFIGGNYGGLRVTNAGDVAPTVLLKNCGFSNSYLGNSLYMQGCKSIIQNCYASLAAKDGFNYHSANNVLPEAIEINNIGRNNGSVGDNVDNGSTIHDGGKIIRLNCEYFGNIGPNLADVNEGTLSFNYGVVSQGSNGASTNKTNFQIQNGIMWNDSCTAFNSDYDFQSYNGALLMIKNCNGKLYIDSNGKIKNY